MADIFEQVDQEYSERMFDVATELWQSGRMQKLLEMSRQQADGGESEATQDALDESNSAVKYLLS